MMMSLCPSPSKVREGKQIRHNANIKNFDLWEKRIRELSTASRQETLVTPGRTCVRIAAMDGNDAALGRGITNHQISNSIFVQIPLGQRAGLRASSAECGRAALSRISQIQIAGRIQPDSLPGAGSHRRLPRSHCR
jgi:hypothetical protein